MADPKITKIEVVVYEHEIQDMGTDYNGFNTVYEKGSVLQDAALDSSDSYRTPGSSANLMAGDCPTAWCSIYWAKTRFIAKKSTTT